MASQDITLKATGLVTNANPLSDAPDGSMVRADDVVIDTPGIVENRCVFDATGYTFASGSSFRGYGFSALREAKTFIVGNLSSGDHNIEILRNSQVMKKANATAFQRPYYTGGKTWKASNVYSKEVGGAVFFNTKTGVKKLEDVADVVYDVGLPKCLNPRLQLYPRGEANYIGQLPEDKAVAYSAVYTRTTSDGRKVVSAPSGREVIRNGRIMCSAGGGFNSLTRTTDVIAPSGAATVNPLMFTDDQWITLAPGEANFAAGNYRIISGNHVQGSGIGNDFTVDSVGANASLTVVQYLGYGPCDVYVEVPVPSDIPVGSYVELYRTGISVDEFSEPPSDMRLIYKVQVDANTIANKRIGFVDNIPASLRIGEAIYTDSRQEGAINENEQPPICSDICNYAGRMFFADTETRNRLEVNLIGVPLWDDGATIREPFIKVNDYKMQGVKYEFGRLFKPTMEPMSALTSNQFYIYRPSDVDNMGVSAAISATARSIVDCINRWGLNGGDAYAVYASGAGDLPGKFFIYSKRLGPSGRFVVASSIGIGSKCSPLMSPYDWNDGTVPSPVRLFRQGPMRVNKIARVGSTVTVDFTFLAGTDRASVGHELIVGNQFWLDDVSGNYSADNSSAVGHFASGYKTVVSVASTTRITYTETGVASPSTDGVQESGYVFTVSNNYYSGRTERAKNRIYFSKKQEFEHVPVLNYIDVGSSNHAIIRIEKTRDTLYIIKEDGVYRLIGLDESDFDSVLVDPTLIVTAARSVQPFGNRLFALSNQGVASITEASAKVLSFDIYDLLIDEVDATESAAPGDIKSFAFGIADETRGRYYIWLPTPGGEYCNHAFVYNAITETWVNWYEDSIGGFYALADRTIYSFQRDDRTMFRLKTGNTRQDRIRSIGEAHITFIAYDIATGLPVYEYATFSAPDIKPGDILSQDESFGGDEIMVGTVDVNSLTLMPHPDYLGAWSDDDVTVYRSPTAVVEWNVMAGQNAAKAKHFRDVKYLFWKSLMTRAKALIFRDGTQSADLDPDFGTITPLTINGWAVGGQSEANVKTRVIPSGVPRHSARCEQLSVRISSWGSGDIFRLQGVSVFYNDSGESKNKGK